MSSIASPTIGVTVLYFAALREQRGLNEESLSLPTAVTIADLYASLAQQHQLTLAQNQLRAAVNHNFCDWNQALVEGDTVAFIPPISGG